MANARPGKRLSASARRELILRAAMREFAREGFDAVSMDRIAGASEVSKPVLYDHFPSKLAVFKAVLEVVREDLLERGRQAVSEESASQEERVKNAARAFFEFCDGNAVAMRVLLLQPAVGSEAHTAFTQVQDVATRGIATLISATFSHLDALELEAVAEFLKSGLHALARWHLSQPKVEANRLAALAGELVWSGLSGLPSLQSPTATKRPEPKRHDG